MNLQFIISGQRWSLHYFPKEWSRRLGPSLWLRKYSHFTIDGNFWWHCFGNLDRGHHYGLLDHALQRQETLVGIWGREEREWEEIWREFQPTLWRCWFELGLKIGHFLSTKFFVILRFWTKWQIKFQFQKNNFVFWFLHRDTQKMHRKQIKNISKENKKEKKYLSQIIHLIREFFIKLSFPKWPKRRHNYW